MSSPVYMEERVHLGFFEKQVARLASLTAYWLIKIKPIRLSRIMNWVSLPSGNTDYSRAAHLRNAVNSVSARCAGNGCLQRSVAVMLLARLYGIPLSWHSGFRTRPFVAHAWVELEGKPVGENLDLSTFLVSLSAGVKQ